MTSNEIDKFTTFEQHRPLLFSIAYRMLGSVMEAEDIVQETFLRFSKSSIETLQSPKAFLSKITTRLCLDHLKSAKVARLLLVSSRKSPAGIEVEWAEVNGLVSVLFRREDQVIGVMSFAGDETHITNIWAVWNPDKLQHLH